MPDPALNEWKKQDKKLKKKRIPKKSRTKAPPKNDKYPTKLEIALTLLEDFKRSHPFFKVKVIVADALYGTAAFLDQASAKFGGIQVISQIRCNQNIRYRGNKKSVETFFNHYTTVPQNLSIRGGTQRQVQVGSARLYVNAHQKKRFVIALK